MEGSELLIVLSDCVSQKRRKWRNSDEANQIIAVPVSENRNNTEHNLQLGL